MTKAIKQLLISQAVSNLADVFFRVAIIANVFVITKSVIATSTVPILIGLSSFIASFLVPLVTKKIALNRVLSYTQLGKTVLLALLLVMLYFGEMIDIPILYFFVIMISILDGFAAPVSYAIVPIYATDLGKTNAALSMSNEGVQLVGWGLGGLLYATLGLITSTIIILCLYIISTILFFALPAVKTKMIESETSIETITRGWRLVIVEPKLRFLLQANLLEILANTIWVSSVILVFVTEYLHKDESYWGYTNTTYSIGILLGAAIVFRLSDKILQYKWQSILFSLIFMSIVTVLIIEYTDAVAFLFFSLFIGVLSQLKEVAESVFLQETVDEADLVNVYSVIEVISTLAFSGFVFVMSSITDVLGVTFSFWIVFFCLLLECLLVFKNRKQIV
ncbi:MFS transporter [Staphylococcus ursi]|uniref:ryptide export MFS transporter n=1 Tax=Staphylococcus sp. MI 10-1553 TaxID=1912064 RepID=UPI0013976A25|nr:ryptide export MFS transporter [Staphylococcus sp. MI 10-1553]QHW36731.1 MFS transporter [Staphylococcus sp. MI 10-1553]